MIYTSRSHAISDMHLILKVAFPQTVFTFKPDELDSDTIHITYESGPKPHSKYALSSLVTVEGFRFIFHGMR